MHTTVSLRHVHEECPECGRQRELGFRIVLRVLLRLLSYSTVPSLVSNKLQEVLVGMRQYPPWHNRNPPNQPSTCSVAKLTKANISQCGFLGLVVDARDFQAKILDTAN